MAEDSRRQRQHQESDKLSDTRSCFARDHDRILYTPELRRLAGITQVAASDTGNLLHNRLTHVMEVAQIGRRLAERLLADPEQAEIARQIGGVDPDVVEAACLGHDLGHPPFGHIAEETLDACAADRHVSDGFEGNAQTFRIITRLAERRSVHSGLNLTRATLNAMLKYPWLRGTDGKRRTKFNCYASDKGSFDWARELEKASPERKGAEAELMDWADDIAYSVGDVEDFYQAGRIPLDRLVEDEGERAVFFESVFKQWDELGYAMGDLKAYRDAFSGLLEDFFPFDRWYAGEHAQRCQLREVSGFLIGRYVGALKLQVPDGANASYVQVDPQLKREVTMLKELTWQYVIRDPSLGTQQFGQRRVIESLFDVYYDACGDERQWHILPPRFREEAKRNGIDGKGQETARVRLVCDLIAGMTEQQAVELCQRLNGISLGPALAILIR